MGNKQIAILQDDIALSPNGSAQDTRRFGLFEIDLRAGELRRQGIKIKLQEQPFQILAELLETPGEVVTREQLRQRLWPADTFVDFDHSLNAAIRRLRDALDDTAENPRFVETVSRRGYRFLAPVTPAPSSANILADAQSIPQVPASWHRCYGWRIVAAIGAIVLVTFGVFLGRTLPRHDPAPMRTSQLTANPVGDPVQVASISRDGRYLAYSDEGGLYLRQIDTGETHSLTLPGSLTASSVNWFPDSVHMMLDLKDRSDNTSLWEVSALGGEPRMLFDDAVRPAVAPDGKKVAFIAGKALRQRIWLADIDGTQRRQLIGEDGDLFGTIVWSPDGTRIAYTTAKFGYGSGVQASIKVLNVRGKNGPETKPLTVLSLFDLQGPLAWASGGQLIYTLSESRPRQMDSNLWSVRLTKDSKPNGPPMRLTNDQGNVFSLSTSADGKRIIYGKGVPQPDVYVGKLDPAGMLSEPQRLTLDDRQDLPFDWTADSKQVIFMSDRTGTFNIYKQSLGQTVPDLLVAGTQQSQHPRLSPDGTELLYVTYPGWGDKSFEVPLMRVPVTGGPPRQIVKANWISNHQCSRAPASVCAYSVLGANSMTFFRFDPVQGNPSQFFEIKDDLSQLYNWSLSPDGTTLAIARGKWGDAENRIHLVSLTGLPERWITIKGWPGLESLDWAADSKSIWAASAGGPDNALLNINLQGTVRVAWRPKRLSVGWAIPSRDGKSLALHVDSASANVWMLDRP